MDIQKLSKFLAQEFNVDEEIYITALKKFSSTLPMSFSSKKSAEFFVDKGSPAGVIGTGGGGKVTMDDVRRVIGEQTKSKVPSEWVSTAARDLAATNGLTESDFTSEKRTGKGTQSPLASGLGSRITIQDVRKILLEKGDESQMDSFFSAPGVAKLAKEAGLSPLAFDTKGEKIKRDDVKAKIAELTAANSFEPIDPVDDFFSGINAETITAN